MATSSDMEIPPAGAQVRQHRNALADAREIIESQFDIGRGCDRQQVQHGIGRSAERDDHGDRVLEGLAGHDLPRPNAALDQFDDGGAGARAVLALLTRRSRLAPSCSAGSFPSASMAEAMVLAVYMPAQEPGPGIAVRSTNLSSLFRDRAVRIAADRLEHRHDVAAARPRAGWCRHKRKPKGGRAARAPSSTPACSYRNRRWPPRRRSPGRRPPSRSNRRSLRATPASSACPACPSKCRPTR